MPKNPKTIREFIHAIETDENAIRFGKINDDIFYAGNIEARGAYNVVFVNQFVLQNIKQIPNKSVNIDATFRITPSLFYQLLIILAEWKGRVSGSPT